jgi:hypothetical protein
VTLTGEFADAGAIGSTQMSGERLASGCLVVVFHHAVSNVFLAMPTALIAVGQPE